MHLLFFALSACDTTTTVANDTAGGDDSGGGQNIGDTADTGETGDTEPPASDLAWDVSGDFAGTIFSLVSIDFSGNAAQMADIGVEVPAEARVELVVPAPDDQLIEMPDVPGLYYAYFIGGLHEDDGDGKWDPDENWMAASSTFSIYLDGILPKEYIDYGLHVGWNALLYGADGQSAVADPLAQPLDVVYNDAIELGGDHDETLTGDESVTTIAVAAFSGTDAPALDWTDVGNHWSLTIEGEPPASHFADVDGDGTVEAVELALAYTDAGGTTGFEGGLDTPVGFACKDGFLVAGWWVAPDPDITRILYIGQSGASIGWNALQITDTGTVILDVSAMGGLTLSTACQPG